MMENETFSGATTEAHPASEAPPAAAPTTEQLPGSTDHPATWDMADLAPVAGPAELEAPADPAPEAAATVPAASSPTVPVATGTALVAWSDPRPITTLPTSRQIMIGGLKSTRKKVYGRPSLPKQPLVLERARLDEREVGSYAKLCGFTEAQGVPLTYPHILAFPLHMQLMLDPSFPFPLIGLVHLSNTIEQTARLGIGQTLAITAGFGRFVSHEKGQAFTVETTATRDGETVWTGSSIYLRLGVKNPQGLPPDALPAGPQPLSVKGPWRLSPGLAKRYAAASGDHNPIHTSSIGARLLGFKRPIIHGMWSKARSLAALLPQAPVTAARAEVAFKTPAFLPSSVVLLSKRHDDATLFELRDRNAEKPHLKGVLTVKPA